MITLSKLATCKKCRRNAENVLLCSAYPEGIPKVRDTLGCHIDETVCNNCRFYENLLCTAKNDRT